MLLGISLLKLLAIRVALLVQVADHLPFGPTQERSVLLLSSFLVLALADVQHRNDEGHQVRISGSYSSTHTHTRPPSSRTPHMLTSRVGMTKKSSDSEFDELNRCGLTF